MKNYEEEYRLIRDAVEDLRNGVADERGEVRTQAAVIDRLDLILGRFPKKEPPKWQPPKVVGSLKIGDECKDLMEELQGMDVTEAKALGLPRYESGVKYEELKGAGYHVKHRDSEDRIIDDELSQALEEAEEEFQSTSRFVGNILREMVRKSGRFSPAPSVARFQRLYDWKFGENFGSYGHIMQRPFRPQGILFWAPEPETRLMSLKIGGEEQLVDTVKISAMTLECYKSFAEILSLAHKGLLPPGTAGIGMEFPAVNTGQFLELKVCGGKFDRVAIWGVELRD